MPVADRLGRALGSGADVLALDDAERGHGGRRAQRVGVEGALVADLLAARRLGGRGVDLGHDVGAAGDRAARQAAGDDLGEVAHVRRHAVALLRAAARPAEAGDHLVEDQEHAVLAA